MNEPVDRIIPRRTPTGALDMDYYTELARRERRLAIKRWLHGCAEAWRRVQRSLSAAATQALHRAASREQPSPRDRSAA